MTDPSTPMIFFDIPCVGNAIMNNLRRHGVDTVADYLRMETDELCRVPLVARGKVNRIDAYLARQGFDTRARKLLQYYQFPGTYLHSPSKRVFHLLGIALASDQRPKPLCGRPLGQTVRSRRTPPGRTLCGLCWAFVQDEASHHA